MTDPKPIRAFVALELSDTVRSGLEKAVIPLRKTGAHVSWVPSDNLHLSLAFLGDIFEVTARLAGSALDEAARSGTGFFFDVSGLGTFGSRRSPRVIWAGVAESPALNSLYEHTTDLLRALDIAIDRRPFRPHITLGRVRSARGRDALVEALAAVGPIHFGRVEVTRMLLMQSTLTPRRAVYSVLHAATLGE